MPLPASKQVMEELGTLLAVANDVSVLAPSSPGVSMMSCVRQACAAEIEAGPSPAAVR